MEQFSGELLEKAKIRSGIAPHYDCSPQAQLGALNALKGKYFELWAHLVLSQKKMLGALVLHQNARVILAESHIQKGWDLKILNANQVDFWQLKATRSTAYVYQALVKYPHCRILTTSEVAQKMRKKIFQSAILDSGLNNRDLENYLVIHFFKMNPDVFFKRVLPHRNHFEKN